MSDTTETPATEATFKRSTFDALASSIEAFAPEMDEKTVLRFDLNFDAEDPTSKDYTYVAIWVANKWFVTGQSNVFSTSGQSHALFMQKLAEFRAHNIELVTAYEKVR